MASGRVTLNVPPKDPARILPRTKGMRVTDVVLFCVSFATSLASHMATPAVTANNIKFHSVCIARPLSISRASICSSRPASHEVRADHIGGPLLALGTFGHGSTIVFHDDVATHSNQNRRGRRAVCVPDPNNGEAVPSGSTLHDSRVGSVVRIGWRG